MLSQLRLEGRDSISRRIGPLPTSLGGLGFGFKQESVHSISLQKLDIKEKDIAVISFLYYVKLKLIKLFINLNYIN